MKIYLRLFAGLKEKVGKEYIQLDIPEGSRIQDLRTCFRDRGLEIVERYLATSRLALNYEFVEPDLDTLLQEGDEVALIPPVSGG